MRLLSRALRALWFPWWFTWELAKANVVVAWEVVTPRHRMTPGILAIHVRSRTDLEVTLLGNLISLTPGTLTLELDPDRDVLYVHVLHISTPDQVKTQIRKLEDRLLRILR